ncbi:MAG: nucleoside-triphosphatase [Ignavibacteria bacterium]|nr:nucleoside-triphosphatase [Ignavibacteria bacterium]
MSNVFIYTGEKGVGKSTYLQEIFLQKPNVCGILQPRINGIKYLVDVVSGEKRRLELENQTADEKIVTIGNYIFSEEVFLWGQQKLVDTIETTNELIIIDEIGPLELSGSGLAPVLSELISRSVAKQNKVLLIVRPALIEKVITQYSLHVPIILHHGQGLPIELFDS